MIIDHETLWSVDKYGTCIATSDILTEFGRKITTEIHLYNGTEYLYVWNSGVRVYAGEIIE